jgi:hypothetical protein
MTTTNNIKDLQLLPQFIMSEEDINMLSNLPANMPDQPLTRKQKDQINSLYHKYISKNQVFKGWGTELYTIEQKEKWPSGPRVKLHEAQRMILGWLLNYNTHYSQLTWKELATHFHVSLTGREANQILISKIYDIN